MGGLLSHKQAIPSLEVSRGRESLDYADPDSVTLSLGPFVHLPEGTQSTSAPLHLTALHTLEASSHLFRNFSKPKNT